MKKLQKKIRKFVASKGGKYRTTTPCTIKGMTYELNETEVRMLQLMCKQTDNFEKFCREHVVYSIDGKGGKYPMIFRPDGLFENDFYPGFYDTCSDLAFEIL